MTIRVLIVDDSALIRRVLQAIIDEQSDMQVVGSAHDADAARKLVRELNPDVITLDIEMPGVDGMVLLRQLMQETPKPVLMVSSHIDAGSDLSFRALELGAVDCISKPKPGSGASGDYGEQLAQKIRAAAEARVVAGPRGEALNAPPESARHKPARRSLQPTPSVVFMGASTGGTEAVRTVLQAMRASCAPILVVQHMPAQFTRLFAQRLDETCDITVKEAQHGEPLLAGHAYIAPGDSHLLIGDAGPQRYRVELSRADPVNLHRPSVDVLFRSAAERVGDRATGVILSGMGKDGPTGLLEMKRSGARTIAQNEETSVVFGMSRDAIRLGAVDEVLALERIGQKLQEPLDGRTTA